MTLSYTITAVVSFLLVELLFFTAVFPYVSSNVPSLSEYYLKQNTPQAGPYFVNGSADREGLNAWLHLFADQVPTFCGGVEATRQVKQASPHTQVIILTSYHEDEHIFPALRAGALSYVLKDIGPDELADTIRKAARGESVLHPRVAARVVQELRGGRRDTPNLFTDLSDRELEVLRLISDGRSNAEIARALIISEKTVKGHVSNILGKLHMLDRTQAAVYAWQQGLMMRKDT